MILRNQAECLKCKDHIMSVSKHDFKTCSCQAICVDGGLDYIRRVGLEQCRDTSICITEELTKDEARKLLGLLVALGDTSVAGTSYLEGVMIYQNKSLPWFPPPKNKRQLIRWLRKLVDLGLIDELTEKGDAQCYWKSKVEIAPWIHA